MVPPLVPPLGGDGEVAPVVFIRFAEGGPGAVRDSTTGGERGPPSQARQRRRCLLEAAYRSGDVVSPGGENSNLTL